MNSADEIFTMFKEAVASTREYQMLIRLELHEEGVRIVSRHNSLGAQYIVSWEQLRLTNFNLLVEHVRRIARQLSKSKATT